MLHEHSPLSLEKSTTPPAEQVFIKGSTADKLTYAKTQEVSSQRDKISKSELEAIEDLRKAIEEAPTLRESEALAPTLRKLDSKNLLNQHSISQDLMGEMPTLMVAKKINSHNSVKKSAMNYEELLNWFSSEGLKKAVVRDQKGLIELTHELKNIKDTDPEKAKLLVEKFKQRLKRMTIKSTQDPEYAALQEAARRAQKSLPDTSQTKPGSSIIQKLRSLYKRLV